MDDTYTLDEVTDMLDELHAVVKGELESELMNSSHTNVLLLRQLFSQAEKWHLKLQADISELENRYVPLLLLYTCITLNIEVKYLRLLQCSVSEAAVLFLITEKILTA